jgi:hypothetical protein
MIPVLAALALLAAILAFRGQNDQQDVLERWDFTLNPEGHKVYSDVAEQIKWDRRMYEESYDEAAMEDVRGNVKQAIHLLSFAAQVATESTLRVLALLRNAGILATHAEAIAPVPALTPVAFNASRLSLLATLHGIVHAFLVSTRERLALRLLILRCAVRAAAGLLRRATLRLCDEMAGRRWIRLRQAREDHATVTDESLATLRLVLASLAAVPRPEPMRQRKPA